MLKSEMRTNPILASFSVASLFLCASVFSGESRVSSPEGLRLFHNMQEALGGARHDCGCPRLRAAGAGRVVERQHGPVDRRGGQANAMDASHRSSRGSSGARVLPMCSTSTADRAGKYCPGTRALVDLSGGELTFAQKYIRDFKLNIWLADRDSSYQITSPSPYVVRIADGEHHASARYHIGFGVVAAGEDHVDLARRTPLIQPRVTRSRQSGRRCKASASPVVGRSSVVGSAWRKRPSNGPR